MKINAGVSNLDLTHFGECVFEYIDIEEVVAEKDEYQIAPYSNADKIRNSSCSF